MRNEEWERARKRRWEAIEMWAEARGMEEEAEKIGGKAGERLQEKARKRRVGADKKLFEGVRRWGED